MSVRSAASVHVRLPALLLQSDQQALTTDIDSMIPVSDPTTSPLTPEQQQQFAKASGAAAKLTRASRMAAFNGGSMLVLAFLCAPFALMDMTNALVAAVLAVLGVIELRCRTRLQRLDPGAGRMLALNQLVLLSAILIYCGWSIYANLTAPGPLASYPELQDLQMDIVGLERTIVWTVYGVVAVGSVIFQGLCALYYFRTGRRLQDYIEQTPPWILKLQADS